MNEEILNKSINARNQEAFFKLANIESNKEWAMNKEVPRTPKAIFKSKKLTLSAGVFNMVRQFLP